MGNKIFKKIKNLYIILNYIELLFIYYFNYFRISTYKIEVKISQNCIELKYFENHLSSKINVYFK